MVRSAYVKVPFQFEIRDVKLRRIGINDALIKIKACGICGTDLHTSSWEAKDWSPFGHEITGIVEKTGINVTHVKPGDRVALESGSFCGVCSTCHDGRVDLCNKARNIFAEAIMGFAEYIVVSKECLIPIGDMPFDEATLIEPMGVALVLFYTSGICLNDDVLVLGLGPIGLMALRFARLAGARKIYAADLSPYKKRFEVAKLYGADEIIHADKTDVGDYKFDRGGVERIIISAPPKTIPSSLKAANFGGTVAFLGIEYGPGAKISFDANEFHFKKLSLKASFAAPALYFHRCIDILKSGAVNIKPLITNHFKLEEIGQAIINVRDNKENVIKSIMMN